MHLIQPKTFADPEIGRDVPLFFLAGPVRGGGDWQRIMAQTLMSKLDGRLIIAVPARYDDDHPLGRYRLGGRIDRFERQVDWERHYLGQAASDWPTGCLVFWLACESKDSPRRDGNSYAMDTRGEVGEWRGRMMHDQHLRVAIGADPYFPGLRQIRRNFQLALPDLEIGGTMEATSERAIAIARQSSFAERAAR